MLEEDSDFCHISGETLSDGQSYYVWDKMTQIYPKYTFDGQNNIFRKAVDSAPSSE